MPVKCSPNSYSFINSRASLGIIDSRPLIKAFAYFSILSIIFASQKSFTKDFLFSSVTGIFEPFFINSKVSY